MLSGQREALGCSSGHAAARPFPKCHHSKEPCSGAAEKPNRRLPGQTALEFCDKVEGEKESDVLGAEGMFSVISTVKSVSMSSWDFTVLYFRDPTFQVVTPTSVPTEGSKTGDF